MEFSRNYRGSASCSCADVTACEYGDLGSVSETLSSDGVLEAGEMWTYTTSYTVTLDDLIDGGDLVNTVVVEAAEVASQSTETATTNVTQICTCEGPPVLNVLAPPKCSGNPPVGTAVIEIFAPGECPMNLLGITVDSSDAKSSISSLPSFPSAITETSGETITWTGPASDAISCLPLASISITIEYACEDGVAQSETYDITQLLLDSVP